MSIVFKAFDKTGQITVTPRRVQLTVTDELATVTTAGYINKQGIEPDVIYPTDVIDMIYSFDAATGVGVYGQFLPTISSGVITLTLFVSPGDVTLPVVNNNLASFDGTSGKIKDSGLTGADFQPIDNIIAVRTGNIGGAGAGPLSVVVAGMTAASVITASIQASTNPVEVQKVTATATGFDILFSGDPGATCTVNYVVFIAPQA